MISKKIFPNYLILAICFVSILSQFTACRKGVEGADINLTYQMLEDKNWYLDYSITGNSKRTYIGQSTYFIEFLKDKTTLDSDGLSGTYTVEKVNNVLQIHVQAKTSSTNAVEYIYDIESIGNNYLVLAYIISGATNKTKLYFSTNK